LGHGGASNEHATWINTLRKLYGDTLIARCPADQSVYWETPFPRALAGTSPDDPNQAEPNEQPADIYRRSSFALNYYTAASVAGKGPYNQISMFVRPAKTIFLAELVEAGPFAVSDHVHADDWWSDARRLAAEQVHYDRHLKKANYGCMDGHAQTLAFEDTYSLSRSGGRRQINWAHNMYDPAIAR
jgi:hypothetical protein